MDKRIKWVDVVRCFGMLAIYLGHFGAQAGRLYAFVYTHHVALFFLISGCLESAGQDRDFLTYAKKIGKTILVPWLMFALASIGFYVLLYGPSKEKILDLFVKMLQGTINDTFIAAPLWFLTCLAVMKLLFWFIRRLKHPLLILLVCFALYFMEAYADIPRAYNLYRAFRFMPYYGIGFVSYGLICKALDQRTAKGKWLLAASGIAALGFSILLFFGINPTGFLLDISYVKMLSPVINALAVIWLYILAAKRCENVRLLNCVGRDSLYLCGGEYFIKVIGALVIAKLGWTSFLEYPCVVFLWSGILLLAAYALLVPVEKAALKLLYSAQKRIG